MEREIYPKSPITESLIDIRIEPPLNREAIETIQKIYDQMKSDYPIKKERRAWEAKFEVEAGVPVSASPTDKGIDGLQFWTEDEKNVCQFRLDGFTYSRLAPYNSWDTHFPEAMKAWGIYQKELKPLNIKRLAVRYINLINLPGDAVELEDYFVEAPKPPSTLPQDLDNFLTRFIIRLDEVTRATITMTIQQTGEPNIIPVLFDIDVFSVLSIESSYDGLSKEFQKMHDFAEKIFIESLTKKAKDLFR